MKREGNGGNSMGMREFGEKNPNYSKLGRKRRDPKIKRELPEFGEGRMEIGILPKKSGSGKKLILH